MGCAASKDIPPDGGHPSFGSAEKAKAKAEFERQLAMAEAAAVYELAGGEAASAQALTGAALWFGQQFEQTTPMLVMPFSVFKAQGRIMKSTKVWRDKALAAGSLVVHEEGSGKVVIFISHTWWDRAFKDATNDPKDPYDKGAPDWQDDYPEEQREMMDENFDWKMVTYQRPKDLKWRVICAGVQRLIEQEGLTEEDVSLWVDWQSIYQDDKVEKLKGVESLIRYATLCQYMLVPTDEAKLVGHATRYPENIPAYGSRGWCRIEYFVFGLLAEMQGHEVQLYAILLDGALNRYPKVQVEHEGDMPSGGALSNPKDKALVTALEDKMIEAYGTALVEVKCKAAGGRAVDLRGKMLRPQHVGALFAAVERYKIANLDLGNNQLGAAGGALVAAALETNTTLTTLHLDRNKLGPKGGMALAEALKSNTTLTRLDLYDNNLGPEGGMALAEALKSNSTLETLGLRDNNLGPKGGMAFAEALKSNTTLEKLSLLANNLGPEGGMALAEALKSNTTLKRLDLDHNKLGPEGGMALAEAVKSNTTLKRLSLGANKLGPKGGMALAEALKSNTALTELWLQANDLGADAEQALRAAARDGLELQGL